MKGQDRISALLTKLHAASPAGFAIALHVRYTSPRYLFQSYAKEWLDTYSREGLVLHDPVVRWGFTHEGTIRWNALDDPARVMHRAAAHGLRYGAVVAFVHDGSRTMAGFARGDRELSDDEINAVTGGKAPNLTLSLTTVGVGCMVASAVRSEKYCDPA